MPATDFDLNLLTNMVAKLGNICETCIKLDILANNIAHVGYCFGQQFNSFRYVAGKVWWKSFETAILSHRFVYVGCIFETSVVLL